MSVEGNLYTHFYFNKLSMERAIPGNYQDLSS